MMDEITQAFISKVTSLQVQLGALWSRVGIPPEEQQVKWNSFITGSLESFLTNFKQLCYSEEKRLFVENDDLLREVVTLSGYLKTMPQHSLLVDVVQAASEAASEVQHNSQLGDSEAARKMLPSFSKLHATEDSTAADSTATAIVDALRRLCSSFPTHRQIHQLLTSELKRLNDTASIRLAMLRLLHKQRALLQLSPEMQVKLRTAYAHKYITQCTPITVWATPKDERSETSVVPVPRPSSQFASARSTDDAEESNAEAKEDLNELQLLLTASLYNDVNGTRDTSFCLQPRPTRASAIPVPSTEEEPHIEQTVPSASCVDGDKPARQSLFEPDLSDVDRYGMRQDLSMDRIRGEASVILQEIEQQNEVMQRQTESDIQCVEAAVARWPGSVTVQPSRAALLSQMKEEVSRLHAAFTQSLQTAQKHSSTAPQGELSQDGSHATPLDTVGGETLLAEALPSSSVVAQCAVPLCIRQLLATDSYAPIRACASLCRDTVVRQILCEHRDHARAAHDELCEVARRYASVTASSSAPTVDAKEVCGGIPSALARQYDAAMAAVEESSVGSTGHSDSAMTPAASATTVQQLQQQVDGVDQVCESLKATSAVLQRRLDLLEQGASLLEKRESILNEKRQMQEGSRERLLSKKINMAKVLLHEENVRRRMAKELPAAMRQLASLMEEWNHLNDIHGMGRQRDELSTADAAVAMAGWAGPFVVHGVHVAELLKAQQTDTPDFAMPHSRAPSSSVTRAVSQTRSGTPSRSLKRSRTSPTPTSGASAGQPPTVRRRLASPALATRHANMATRPGKGSPSISPPPRSRSPTPSVFQRLHTTSSSRVVKKEEPASQ